MFLHLYPQVSADTTKKRIHSLSMELMDARNKLDAKDKVGYSYTSAGHVFTSCVFEWLCLVHIAGVVDT